jgi:hypothetical protein
MMLPCHVARRCLLSQLSTVFFSFVLAINTKLLMLMLLSVLPPAGA